MEEKYNEVISNLPASIKEDLNYSKSNLLNNTADEDEDCDRETLISNILNAPTNGQMADGTQPLCVSYA